MRHAKAAAIQSIALGLTARIVSSICFNLVKLAAFGAILVDSGFLWAGIS